MRRWRELVLDARLAYARWIAELDLRWFASFISGWCFAVAFFDYMDRRPAWTWLLMLACGIANLWQCRKISRQERRWRAFQSWEWFTRGQMTRPPWDGLP